MITADEANKHIWRKLQVRRTTPPYLGRFYTERETTIPELFADLGYTVGAEVGVQRGIYSRILLDKVPNLKLYCIDPWTPYGRHPTQWKQDLIFQHAKDLIGHLNVEFIKKTSENALADIPDTSLDFVYIDGIHEFDFVMFDIIRWSKKVRSGGIVSGHDYFHYPGVDVVFAVEAYTRAHNIRTWYITHEGETRSASFFWVKP